MYHPLNMDLASTLIYSAGQSLGSGFGVEYKHLNGK